MALHLSWLATAVHATHDDRDDVVGRGEIDIVHDQHLTITEARLGADVGLPGGFAASLVLPLRLTATTIDYYDTAGVAVALTTPGIHHRDETIAGLGDPIVLGGYGRSLGAWRVAGRVGVTVPLGRTEADPFARGAQGLAHQHVQLGTGTVNPVLTLEASRSVGPWRVGGFGFTQQALYANGNGYQAGDRYAAGAAARRRVGARWTLRGGAEVQAETAERWGGVVPTDDGNQGRFDAMLAAGATWQASPRLALDLGVKVPVVTRVVGGQLAMPAILELGVAWTFGGGARADDHADEHDDDSDHDDDHDHDHDHGDHDDGGEHAHGEHAHGDHAHGGDHDHAADAPPPDAGGLDIADIPAPGPGQAVAAVAGKVTIVDVWATWCAPCKTLAPRLVELVRAQPDRVALRRIDVSRSDAWTIPLPYVVVFDVAGRKVLEISAGDDLDALLARVRAAIAPPPPPAGPPAAASPKRPPPKRPPPKRPARVSITVTADGFQPADVTVPVGAPVVLVFERTTARTCATEVVMTVAGRRILQPLPLNHAVEVSVTFPTAGTITYACAMDMIRGTITAR